MKGKRGQVTIFVIIGIVVVIVAGLIYFLYPGFRTDIGTGFDNPEKYIQECIEEDLREDIKKITYQGGSIDPEHYIMFQGEKIEYLCYTSEYYANCVVQRALLKEHIEKQVLESIKEKANSCFNSLEQGLEEKGYTVDLRKGEMEFEMVPQKSILKIKNTLNIEKGEILTYNGFEVEINNNLYQLVFIALSIIEWETTYGDAETTIYMDNYRDVKVEKYKQGDGSTIYVLSDRNSDNKLKFASRSIPWPPGYA